MMISGFGFEFLGFILCFTEPRKVGFRVYLAISGF